MSPNPPLIRSFTWYESSLQTVVEKAEELGLGRIIMAHSTYCAFERGFFIIIPYISITETFHFSQVRVPLATSESDDLGECIVCMEDTKSKLTGCCNQSICRSCQQNLLDRSIRLCPHCRRDHAYIKKCVSCDSYTSSRTDCCGTYFCPVCQEVLESSCYNCRELPSPQRETFFQSVLSCLFPELDID